MSVGVVQLEAILDEDEEETVESEREEDTVDEGYPNEEDVRERAEEDNEGLDHE